MADLIPNSRRRWFRFSLRTMFVVVTLLALALGHEVNLIRERREFREWVRTEWQHAGREDCYRSWCGNRPPIPFWRKWLGDEPMDVLPLPEAATSYHADEARRLFPEGAIRPYPTP